MFVNFFMFVCFCMLFGNHDIIASAQQKNPILKSLSLSALDNKASYGAVFQDDIPCCFAIESVQPEFSSKEIKVALAHEIPMVQGYRLLESRPTNYRMGNRRESMITAISIPHYYELSSEKEFCYCLVASCTLVAAECCCCRK